MTASVNRVSGAVISACQQFRYYLWRHWDVERPVLCFIMLNPSKADAVEDDPTIRKCIGFAKRYGYGGIDVLNLFAYRSTDPIAMRNAGYLVGPDNDHYINTIADVAASNKGAVVCAWGKNASGHPRTVEVCGMLDDLGIKAHYLRLNGDGSPAHPLMLPYSCRLTEWRV